MRFKILLQQLKYQCSRLFMILPILPQPEDEKIIYIILNHATNYRIPKVWP